MREIIVDMTNMEVADDWVNATAHYGGEVKVSEGYFETNFFPAGTDRDDGPWLKLREHLESKHDLDFSEIEEELNEACDSNDDNKVHEALEKLQQYWYLSYIGDVVKITCDNNYVVKKIEELEEDKYKHEDVLEELLSEIIGEKVAPPDKIAEMALKLLQESISCFEMKGEGWEYGDNRSLYKYKLDVRNNEAQVELHGRVFTFKIKPVLV